MGCCKRYLVIAALAACGAMPAMRALAAEGELAPVLVTAQRRLQPINEVPASVVSVGGDVLQRDSIADIGMLTSRVPGFAANTNGIPSLYLRGIGSNDLGAGGDPSVGVYQDGLYLGRSTGSVFDLLDVERVEIIRGPQGVLFGRNSAGGAINVVTRKPDPHDSAQVSAQLGSFDERRVTGVVNLPVAESVTLRLAATNLERDGFIFNRYSGRHIGNADQWATRAALAWRPSDALTVQMQFGAEGKNADGSDSRSLNQGYLTGTPFDAYYSDLDHGFERRKLRHAVLRLDGSLGAWQIGSATAYRKIRYADLVDSTGTGLYARRLYAGTHEVNRQFSHELLLQRDFGDHQLVSGASYYRQQADQLSILESTSDTVNFAASRLLGFPVTVIPPGRYHAENSRNKGLSQSLSAFVDLTAHVAPRWEVVAGVRFTRDSKVHSVDGEGSNNGFAVVFPATPVIRSDSRWKDWSPRAGINFRISGDALAYFQYAEGYKSGGFNSFVPAAPFSPEHVDQLEIGYKWSSPDSHLSARFAGFHYRYRDLQVSVIEGGRAVIRNAARARGRGLDMDLSARLGEHYMASLVAGWLDAQFTRFLTGTSHVDLGGNALTYSPDLQLSASVGSRHAVGAMQITSALTWSYSGRQYFDVTNNPALTENRVGLVDVSLSVSPRTDTSWRATLFAKNATNTRYVTTMGGIAKETLDAPASRRGMPRTVGVRFELTVE